MSNNGSGTDDLTAADLETIARRCNSAIWFLQGRSGDRTAPSPRLEDAPPWAAESTYESIRAVLAGVTPEQLWQDWAAARRAGGWVYGKVKDPAAKTHPCLADDYAQLPEHEQFKDEIFLGIIRDFTERKRKEGWTSLRPCSA